MTQPSEPVLPPVPQPGSTIAIVSPSAPLVAEFPHRVERGTAYLEGLGYEVRLMPNATLSTGWTAGSGQERAADINAAFTDPDVSVVMAAIGGNHSAQLLPYLDFELIAANPKVFQGYSDNTLLHWALLKRARLQTFHGPMLLSELAEYPEVLPYTGEWMTRAWSRDWAPFEPVGEWTDEFLDWAEKRDLGRPREMNAASGWRCIRPGTAQGPLMGGCLESIAWHLRKSEIWTEPTGAIFFIESSEETPSPEYVDAYLTTFERDGLFDAVAGLIVARPYGYTDDDKEVFFEVIERRTEDSGIPILADVDIGHTDPMLTLPMGAMASLDAAARFLTLI